MTKSIYSLLLSDAVVSALDRMAYEMNMSRSALANQILAEHLSYVTPEKRMHDIFSVMENMLSEVYGFRPLPGASDSMLSLRSSLDYKYNPTVRYSVELYKTEGAPQGQIKAVLRSQNSDLLLCFTHFFRLWQSVEESFCGNVRSEITEGKYVREIGGIRGGELTPSEQGTFISDYLSLLDRSLKLFFSMLDSPAEAKSRILRMYSDFLNTKKEVLL